MFKYISVCAHVINLRFHLVSIHAGYTTVNIDQCAIHLLIPIRIYIYIYTYVMHIVVVTGSHL
jgi:hypothetical protein